MKKVKFYCYLIIDRTTDLTVVTLTAPNYDNIFGWHVVDWLNRLLYLKTVQDNKEFLEKNHVGLYHADNLASPPCHGLIVSEDREWTCYLYVGNKIIL